jgi:hypothetical protein
MANGGIVDVQVSLNKLDRSVKSMHVNTDGALQFSNHPMFVPDPEIIRPVATAGVCVAVNYTEIDGQKIYDLTPLTLGTDEVFSFTITNDSGAARQFQIDLLM